MVYEVLTPGTRLLITDSPVLVKQTTGVALEIMYRRPPQPLIDLADRSERAVSIRFLIYAGSARP